MLAHAAIETLYRSGISRAVATQYGGLGSIFAFHSVVRDRSCHLHTPNRTSLTFLDAWLVSLRRTNTDVVTLHEAMRRLRQPGGRRFVVITFDDGYLDNFLHVLPLFERHGIPFTVYVTSGLILRQVFCWWIGLERLFQRHENVDIEPMGRRWRATTVTAKVQASREAFEWVHADVTARAPLLRGIFVRYGISIDAIADEEAMNAEQLRTLAQSPLVTIGAHSVSHPELAKLSEADCRAEMLASKSTLEGIVEKPVLHFSYPFGSPSACGRREAAIAQDVGFTTAVTTRNGCLFRQHLNDVYLLPRLPPNGRKGLAEWLSLMHVQRDGLVRFIQSRGGAPVVTL